jgi:hypothetical protein
MLAEIWGDTGMRGKWRTAWLAVAAVTLSLICASLPGLAADAWDRGGMPLTLAGAPSPMEAQMLGEKPFQSRPATPGSLLNPHPSLHLDQDGGAVLKLPQNLEMRISVLYNRDAAAIEPQKRGEASLLMQYSLDYRLLPNLNVGLNAYLYRPDPGENLLARPFGDRVMGLGPGLKYDLGRWSFLMKSQLETGNREHGNSLQNSVRVWYAF